MATTDHGSLFSWGWSNEGVLGISKLEDEQYVSAPKQCPHSSTVPSEWAIVRSGAFHVLALAANGDLYAWGRAASGRLGIPTTKDFLPIPTIVPLPFSAPPSASSSLSSTTSSPNLPQTVTSSPALPTINLGVSSTVPASTRVVDIACGAHHNLLLTNEGKIYSWGSGYSGQLGHGNRLDFNDPKLIEGNVSKIKFKSIAAGYYHSMAIDDQGNIWTWGGGEDGQLGHGPDVTYQSHPKLLHPSDKIHAESIAASDFNSCCITDNGELYIWGNNRYSQLGVKKSDKKKSFVPVLLTTGISAIGINTNSTKRKWKKCALGIYHVAAINDGGKLCYWGKSVAESSVIFHEPTLVKGISKDIHFIDVASGGYHMLALTDKGILYSWGISEYGQLGIPQISDSQADPIKVDTLVGVIKIACGMYHSLAIAQNAEFFIPVKSKSSSRRKGHDDNSLDESDNESLSGSHDSARILSNSRGIPVSAGSDRLRSQNSSGSLSDSAGNASGSLTPTEIPPKPSSKKLAPLVIDSPDKSKKRDRMSKSPRKNHRTNSVSEIVVPFERTESPHKSRDRDRDRERAERERDPDRIIDLPKVNIEKETSTPKTPNKVLKTPADIHAELKRLGQRENEIFALEEKIRAEKIEIQDRRMELVKLLTNLST